MKYIFSCLLFIFGLSILTAQQSPRKLVKQAEAAMAAAQYVKAAESYAQAWKQKPDKLQWRYHAGVAYLKAGNYKLAAEALLDCTTMSKSFPLVNLYYARALKQSKEYARAIQAFNVFLEEFSGPQQEKMGRWVKNEIEGCHFAQQLKTASESGSSLKAQRLDEIINTVDDEFGPAFFTNDILYYSSAKSGSNATILRSQRLSGDWLAAVAPEFPKMPLGHFCHGSLSPDQKRFYFTICEGAKDWESAEAACDIYVTQYSGIEWSAPVKMRDYIKMDGTTATHPCVVHVDGIEFIYFSTNRIGGKGGMDIWYTYRFLDNDDFDYALPQNAGGIINTPGDEVTPYYDVFDKALYFSSNGHPSIGGFDIFKASGQMEEWDKVEWLPLPNNSPANDYYFVKTPDGQDQYFVSNRATEEKNSTQDDDIFHLASVSVNPKVKGKIFAENSRKVLDQIEVSLYEIRQNGKRRLLQSRISMDGNYAFDLIPGKQFRIEVFRLGYQLGFYDFDTTELLPNDRFEQDFFLSSVDEGVLASRDEPVFNNEEPDNIINNPADTKTRPSQNVNELPQLPTSRQRYTPKHRGVYYKVQLSAIIHFDEQDPTLRRVAQFGRLDLEYILEKGWIRLLLADYFTLEEAQYVMKQCRVLGYPDAFIVKYLDGKRMQ